jgi:hypothetical protein
MTRVGENDKKAKKSGGRSQRLAAALRENLRRRKAQDRGRGRSLRPALGQSRPRSRTTT